MRVPVTSGSCAGVGPGQPSLTANQLDTTLKLSGSGSGGSATADPGSEVELDTNRREV